MRILFIPVSGRVGVGEYTRSMIIADELHSKFCSKVEIAFILSKEAPYSQTCPYQTFLTERSPTFCTDQVIHVLNEFIPDLVIFDSSGRAKQLAHAKEIGAKTIFISYYDKKRSQGLRINRLINIDLHLVAQFPVFISPLSLWQKIKLKFYKKSVPCLVGSIFSSRAIEQSNQILKKYNLKPQEYIFISAGSGAHVTENGGLVSDVFYNAIKQFGLEADKVVQVFGSLYPKSLPNTDGFISLKNIQNEEFVALLSGAKWALISGGDTLGQAISLKVPCVSVPVAKDQFLRVKKASELGLCIKGSLESENIETAFQTIRREDDYHRLKLRLNDYSYDDFALNKTVKLIDSLMSKS